MNDNVNSDGVEEFPRFSAQTKDVCSSRSMFSESTTAPTTPSINSHFKTAENISSRVEDKKSKTLVPRSINASSVLPKSDLHSNCETSSKWSKFVNFKTDDSCSENEDDIVSFKVHKFRPF